MVRFTLEVHAFKEKLETLQLDKTTREKIEKSINQLLKISTMSPEYSVLRNYVETLPCGPTAAVKLSAVNSL